MGGDMNSKPKILVIENSIGVTGALKSITQAAFDSKNDFEFQFLIPQKSEGRAWIEGMGHNDIYEFPMRELSRNLSCILLYIPYLILNAVRLNRLIKKNSISIIHSNDIYNLLPVVIRLLGNKTPYICHIRFLPDRFPVWLFTFWFKLHSHYSYRIIAVSKSVADQLPERHKVTVIYDELPDERYHEPINQKKNRTDSIFLYVSNFMKGKGQDFAIEAFSKIHNRLPNWKLRFVGGDMGLKKNSKYRELLKKRAIELGIHNKTEWVGFTKEIELEYKQADIVLNFSESESFSMTCLEALSFGRPLIATDCGGPSEILDGGKVGILVPNRNIGVMANSMEGLARNATERERMGASARQVVTERFSKENTSMKLKGVYISALGK